MVFLLEKCRFRGVIDVENSGEGRVNDEDEEI